MDPTKAMTEVLAVPVFGALLVIAMIVIVFLFRAFVAEKDARIKDATAYGEKMAAAQKELSGITTNLGKVAESQENEREERERLERELRFRERHTPIEEITPIKPKRLGRTNE